MGRRHQAEVYEEEYQEEEHTRALLPSTPPSYDDQFEDRTRSPRESNLLLEGLARSAERARAAFVAPAEIEGDRSPAMRARRQSFVDASELLPTPKRPSFVAPSERASYPSYPEASERRVRKDRPAPIPAPPTPRTGRHSYVASSERADFASSVPDADEVTSFRAPRASEHPVSSGPVSRQPRASQHPASSAPASRQPRASQPPVSSPPRRPSQHPAMEQPVREATYAPAIESSEIEEVAAEEASRPVDYEALKRFLFDDVPANEDDRSVSMMTPVAQIAPRSTHVAFRPAMHAMNPDAAPSVHPAARISHHAFRPQQQMPGAVSPVSVASAPQMAKLANMPTMPMPMTPPSARASHHSFRPPMMTGPFPQHAGSYPGSRPNLGAPVGHDSYGDSSWIVPTPPFASNAAPMPEAGGFKVTLSFIAAAITAVLALGVMIAAIVFIRSEEPNPAASLAPAPSAPAPVVVDTKPAPVVAAPVAAEPVAPVAPVVEKKIEKKAAEKPVEKVAAEKPVTPVKKKVAAAVIEEEDDAPTPAKKTAAKSAKDKQVEQMLADLQEQQLKR